MNPFVHLIGHKTTVAYLTTILQTASPQAMLLVGADHTGKETMARAYAASLLGCTPEDTQRHPRIICLTAGADEKTGKPRASISVDAVRQTRALLSLRYSEPLIILIPRACELREESSNALLKIMEEPHAHTYFLLCARSTDAVLPTIRSRCAVIRLGCIFTQEIAQSLCSRGVADALAQEAASFAQGCPGLALVYATDDALRDRVFRERTRFEKIMMAGGLHEAQPLIADLFGKKEDHLQSRVILTEVLEWWLQWLRHRAPMHGAVPLIAKTIVELNENMHPRLLLERVVIQLAKS